MHIDLIKFFTYQRSIFGICPCCNTLFRLAECKIFSGKTPADDWKDKLDKGQAKLNLIEDKMKEKANAIKAKHTAIGQKKADRFIKKIDTVFRPMKINPADSKVISHPVDYIIFDGMARKDKKVNKVILLDNEQKSAEGKKIQKSIIRAIEKENYEWMTMRVDDKGKIIIE